MSQYYDLNELNELVWMRGPGMDGVQVSDPAAGRRIPVSSDRREEAAVRIALDAQEQAEAAMGDWPGVARILIGSFAATGAIWAYAASGNPADFWRGAVAMVLSSIVTAACVVGRAR